MANTDNIYSLNHSEIPSDWKISELGSVGKVSSGGTPDTNNEKFWNGNINWCTPTDITKLNGSKYIGETIEKISSEGLKNSSATLLPKGSVIVCTRATIGKAAISVEEISTNQGFKNIIPNDKKVDVEFLYYSILNSEHHLLRLGNGSTFLEISKSDFENFRIPIPPLPEQKAIAHILGLMDTAINKNNLLIAKKELQKKWLMQMLLTGKKRLKGFEKTKWEEKRMKDVCDKFLNGGTPSTQNKNYWAGNIPWITGADVVDHTITGVRRFITPQAVIESSTNVIPRGNLLLVTRTGVGKIAIAPFDVAISQDLTGLLLNTRVIDTAFAFYFLGKSGNILTRLNQGTSIIGITRDVLEAIKVPCPSKEEQNSIVSVIQAADKEIQLLKSKTEKLREEKKGLMQVLLTGKKRLKYDTQNI